ncbi:hypothetical protein BCR33DRAFT_718770 [Rhizoclosmatium globosum]|uniref:Nucleotide-diphospho-sugar transferase domain-containing protein n=1 Tax=Rhizoclosmatium globosum TaxID=329046 RepID=A0A1Y2C3J0_9FUNG|nr:hypothetical protein BCR33DRAFT_718770 [Rhizoclosmatium globosum]|eukprot:ORY41613.1 hypothetical protein BCR33DRAFT_718770 [Rhizoclosmatium globosum]
MLSSEPRSSSKPAAPFKRSESTGIIKPLTNALDAESTAKKSGFQNRLRVYCTLALCVICLHWVIRFTVISDYEDSLGAAHHHPFAFEFDSLQPNTTIFKSKAIITLYAANESRVSGSFDTQFADTLMLAYSVLHNPETSLDPKHANDIEFVVALLHLPTSKPPWAWTSAKRKPCPENSCLSKLYLFGLEGTYTHVLFLDPSVIPLKPISTVFQYVQNWFGDYLAAVQALGMVEGTFDSSVLLFTPSNARFHRLMSRLHITNKFSPYFGDQGLLNWYFSGSSGPSGKTWIKFPLEFNIQEPQLRDSKTLEKTVLLQHKFWTVKSDEGPVATEYLAWKERMTDLQKFLEPRLNPNHYLIAQNKTFVTTIPTRWNDLHTLMETGMLGSRVVIETLFVGRNPNDGGQADRSYHNRQRYAARYPGAIYHFFQNMSETQSAVWQKAYDAHNLLQKFDWIWLLDAGDAYIMNAEIDVRVLLAQFLLEARYRQNVDIVIAHDMNKINAGSFFIRSTDWVLKEFIPAWKKYQNEKDEQQAIWDMMAANEKGIKERLFLVPQHRQNLFNSYYFGPPPLYKQGDFVLHGPSLGGDRLNEYLAKNNWTEV